MFVILGGFWRHSPSLENIIGLIRYRLIALRKDKDSIYVLRTPWFVLFLQVKTMIWGELQTDREMR